MPEQESILLLSQVFPPQNGGSGRWFWEVYSRFCEATIVTDEVAGGIEFDQTHDLPVFRIPFEFPFWGLSNWKSLRRYAALFRRLNKIVADRRISTVHCGRCLPEGLLGLALKKWRGLPYSCYVHGEELSLVERYRETATLARVVFAGAQTVIANSKNTASLLVERWGIPADKVAMIHPGVNTSHYTPAINDARRLGLGWEDRKVVLTVGRLQKRKGHDHFIRALPQIRDHVDDILYAVAGAGDELGELKNLARQLGVEGSVQFLGELDDDELLACYQQCDLFALPNREVDGDFEGFGIVLLEAQACGKAVLAGDSGGTAETMQVGRTGVIVDCRDPAVIASQVIDLLQDDERRAEMGQLGRAWTVEHFDWEALSVQAADLFGARTRKPENPVEVLL